MYGVAQEAGLKLRESAQLWTEVYPQMEYRHGPIAVAQPGRAVWIFGSPVEGIVADIAVTGAALVADDIDPVADLIRAQLLAVERAQAPGLDPDRPRNLTRSVVLEVPSALQVFSTSSQRVGPDMACCPQSGSGEPMIRSGSYKSASYKSASYKSCAALLATALTGAVLVGASGPAAGVTAAGCRPTITDLGDPLGGGFSYADAVATNGIIAGTAFLPDGDGRAVMWRSGKAVDLGVVGKYDESFAHGVSTDGTVVGELDYKQTGVAPFIYSQGHMRKLPGLGGDFGYAENIDSRDVIVGTASDAAGNPHAVIWTNHGRTIHDLGIATSDVSSYASGINTFNTATGDSDDTAGNERPAVFTHDGPVLLETKKTAYGSAEDINDHGRIIGISFLANGDQHATYWKTRDNRDQDLGLLPGGSFASLVDIDNAGRAVGGGNLSQSPDTTHAIFWSGKGSLRMLEPLSGHLDRDFAVARALDEHGNAVEPAWPPTARFAAPYGGAPQRRPSPLAQPERTAPPPQRRSHCLSRSLADLGAFELPMVMPQLC